MKKLQDDEEESDLDMTIEEIFYVILDVVSLLAIATVIIFGILQFKMDTNISFDVPEPVIIIEKGNYE